jgi:hypothetical protein
VTSVAVVVEMELDLAESGAHQASELIEELGAILLTGKEPAVARRAAVAVAELAKRWIALGPRSDAAAPDVVGGLAPQRLVVIAQREQDVARTTRLWRSRTAHEVAAIVDDPVMQVLVAKSA